MPPRPPTVDQARHPHLVFTSAGPHSSVRGWVDGPRGFDLFVVDYADPDGHRDVADFHVARPGKKFPNLHACVAEHRDLFAAYEAVFVADDDVVVGPAQIDRLFATRREHDLEIVQPAFHPRGIVSFEITLQDPTCRLRTTTYVETTCPLFRTDALFRFLDDYDPTALFGWGVEHVFLSSLGPAPDGRVAIIDEVAVVNPHHRHKGSLGETEQPHLRPFGRRAMEAQFEAWAAGRDLPSLGRGMVVLDAVPRDQPGRALGHLVRVLWRLRYRRQQVQRALRRRRERWQQRGAAS